MNTSELAMGVAAATSSSEAAAGAAVLAVFDQISAAVASGDEVSITGFDKFAVKDRPERQGLNPATGEAITVSASR